jgi:zinc transport system substrate-binding protein
MKRLLWLAATFLLVLAAVYFLRTLQNGQAAGAPDSGRLKVVTSFLPVYCFAVNIAGDLADVENLLPDGIGPHDYQFTPRDVRTLSSAHLLIVNGLGLEDWLGKAVRSAGRRSLKVIELSQGLKEELIHDQPELRLAPGESGHRHGRNRHSHHHGPNPHIWLDPSLAAHGVTNILRAFQSADPVNSEAYAENAQRYIERLHALDAELIKALEPVKQTPMVTYHNAFPYFARHYGLNIVGVIEEVAEVSPSARYLEELMRVLREKEVKVIFTEPQYSARLARQIARDLNIELAELDTLEAGPLTPEAYEEGMRHNLSVLIQHLQ